MLITGNKPTLTDEIALQYYLFGNGSTSLRVLLALCIGSAMMPHNLLHFYKMYQKGKAALRFYDINHLALLYQPVARIKETFMIQEP
jgi:Na+(H+)/acetate symporter ActP